MIKLSFVIPTLNEEDNIRECIETSSDIAGEVIVVDMGSWDKTREIAKMMGARVFEEKYEKKKIKAIQDNVNFGIEKCKNEWIMRMDADERLTDDFKKELIEKIEKEGDKKSAFLILRKQWFINGFLKGGDWAKSKIVRVFKKGKARYDLKVNVHEKFVVDGEVGEIKTPFLHYSHMNLASVIRRFNEYTDSEGIDKSKNHFLLFDMMVRPFYVFTRTMTIKGEWKDGTRGVVAGLLWAFYQFISYAKAWEVKNKIGKR